MLCKAGAAGGQAEVITLVVFHGAGYIFTSEVNMFIKVWFAEVELFMNLEIVGI